MENQKTNKSNKSSLVNSERINIKMLVSTGMFTAVICIMAQLVIPIQPIPFSLALFAIFLTGALLPPRYAFLSILVYILLGAFGVPVFAGFKGGLHVLTGMTGGYIAAYPLMGLITAFFYKISVRDNSIKNRSSSDTYYKKATNNNKFLIIKNIFLIIGMLLSLIVCYTIGTLWFTIVSGTNFASALSLCVIPFVPFDLLKLILAVTISSIIRKAISLNP